MSTYRQYLKTLRRVPDDIMLATATRKIITTEGDSCLCGWVVREALARVLDVDAARVPALSVDETAPFSGEPAAYFGDTRRTSAELARRLFGGTPDEWRDIYYGIDANDTVANVEEAFARRVLEAVA